MGLTAAWHALWATKAEAPEYPRSQAEARGYSADWRRTYYGGQPGSKVNWAAEACPTWLSAPVMACLAWYGDNLPTADLAVYTPSADDSQEDMPDFEHPAVTVFDDADGMDAHELLGLCVLSDKCFGETFLVKVDAIRGMPARLQWVPPYTTALIPAGSSSIPAAWGIRPVGTRRRLIDGYEYWVDGLLVETYAPEEVVYLRAMVDPEDPRHGMSRLRAGLRAIVGLNRAETYLAQFLRYGSARKLFVPESGFASLVDEATAGGIQSQIFVDLDRAGLVPVASVPGQLLELGSDPTDAAPPEMVDRFESTTCALMGVHPMVVGLASGAQQRTYANFEEANRQSLHNGLIPMQDRFARGFTRQLLPDYGPSEGQYMGWDRSKVAALREDRNEAIARAKEMAGGKRWASTNEVRAEAGLPPLDWGDDLEEEPEPLDLMPGNGRPPAFAAARNGDGAEAEAEEDEA